MSLNRWVLLFFLLVSACNKESEYKGPESVSCESKVLGNQFIVVQKDGRYFLSNSAPVDMSNISFYEPNYRLEVPTKANPVSGNSFLPANLRMENDWSAVGLNQYWNKGFYGQNIVVGVVDTGVDTDSPYLIGRIRTNSAEEALDGEDTDGNGFIDDVHGWNFAENVPSQKDEVNHGSSIAHLIVANPGSVAGSGIAPQAEILPLDFIGDSGGGSEMHAIQAIEYGLQHGVKIFNNSWSSTCSALLHQKYKEWEKLNVLFVHSAGNSGESIDQFPLGTSSFSGKNFVIVGSVDYSGYRSHFSSFGKFVDIYTYGEEIVVPRGPTEYGEIQFVSGTSYSTAIVTGAAALIWSANPDWNASQVKDFLIETSWRGREDIPVLSLDTNRTFAAP